MQVSEDFLQALFGAINQNPQTQLRVDVAGQIIEVLGSDLRANFEIDPYKKTCLINGYDDIDYLVSKRAEIAAFEAKQKQIFGA